MSVAIIEQETTINFYREGDKATIYTSDSTMMTKLDKLVKNEKNKDWKVIEIHKTQDGEIVGKTYETKKRLLSYRSGFIERKLTNEQQEKMQENMRKMQECRTKR